MKSLEIKYPFYIIFQTMYYLINNRKNQNNCVLVFYKEFILYTSTIVKINKQIIMVNELNLIIRIINTIINNCNLNNQDKDFLIIQECLSSLKIGNSKQILKGI